MRIGYIRTSTGDQSGAGQRDALKAAGCERIFHDKGVSGGAVSKPQLERALKAASEGDALVVTRLDRLARSMKFLIEDVERIGALGIDFVSLHEAIDTTTPGGRLFFHISAAFAEFERDVIRQRTKEGMAAAKRAGRPVGRPPAITDDRWPGIQQMLDSGMTVAAAARTAGVPRQSVYRRLQADADPDS
jgi:DNA invertase Pin-like site-specific DNA recombinase